eukprot:TRINITY_DN207_c0_g1_i1.p1 TRINITY_DN207_c0_g1~~TRINITY_DN207_c0_g1_i1.p1  ORF type:complete len:1034 (+),score=158.71 TRINITY_DN207_c0_g1_i1:3-3104(+)
MAVLVLALASLAHAANYIVLSQTTCGGDNGVVKRAGSSWSLLIGYRDATGLSPDPVEPVPVGYSPVLTVTANSTVPSIPDGATELAANPQFFTITAADTPPDGDAFYYNLVIHEIFGAGRFVVSVKWNKLPVPTGDATNPSIKICEFHAIESGDVSTLFPPNGGSIFPGFSALEINYDMTPGVIETAHVILGRNNQTIVTIFPYVQLKRDVDGVVIKEWTLRNFTSSTWSISNTKITLLLGDTLLAPGAGYRVEFPYDTFRDKYNFWETIGIPRKNSTGNPLYGMGPKAGPGVTREWKFQLLNCTLGCVSCNGTGLVRTPFSGNCFACDESLSFAVSVNDQTCTLCPSGTYDNVAENPDHCRPCTTGCITCTGSGLTTDVCSACDEAAGWLLSLDGTRCVKPCDPGQFANTSENPDRCRPCTTGCITCTGSGLTTDVCSACDEAAGWLLSLDGTRCVKPCDPGQFANTSENPDRCRACTTGCASCNGTGLVRTPFSGNCFACDESLSFAVSVNDQTCTLCPSGTYDNVAENPDHCRPCTTGCATCNGVGLQLSTSSGNCSACSEPGFFINLLGDSCGNVCTGVGGVSGSPLRCTNCAERQFWDGSQCSNCSVGCRECTGLGLDIVGNQCQRCDDPIDYIRNSTTFPVSCIKPCPPGTFTDPTVIDDQRTCRACPVECATCSSATQCTTCAPTYFSVDGAPALQCVPTCTPPSYPTPSRVCVANAVPKLLSVSPPDGSSNLEIAKPTTFSLVFDKDIKKGLETAAIRFFVRLDVVELFNVPVSQCSISGDRTLTFQRTFNTPLASYDLAVDADVVRTTATSAPNAAYSLDGFVDVTGSKTWSVQVEADTVAPHLQDVTLNRATNGVFMKWSEPVIMATGSSIILVPRHRGQNITIPAGAVAVNGSVASFSADFLADQPLTDFTVGYTAGAFRDAAGNAAPAETAQLRIGTKSFHHNNKVALIVGLVLGLFFLMCALCFLLYWYCVRQQGQQGPLPVMGMFFKSPNLTDWIKVRPDRKVVPTDYTTDYTNYEATA